MPCCNETVTERMASTTTQTDCFAVRKIYDWVKKKMEQTVLVMIPREDRAAVEAAAEAGDELEIKAYAVVSETRTNVALIERKTEYCACVQFRKCIPLHVSIYDKTTSTMLSEFIRCVQQFDSCRLCFPEGMPDDAISVKIVDVDAGSLSASPVDGNVAFLVSACQEILVALDVMVKLKVEGTCSSRQGFECLGSVSCEFGSPTYPKQCPSQTTCS